MTKEEWEELESMSYPTINCRRYDVLMKKTETEEEHPEDYNGPCFCKLCQSYAMGG